MIYNGSGGYEVKFYADSKGYSQVFDYIESLKDKERAKVLKYIEFLREHDGVLDEPYSKHIVGKIRELRIDFSTSRHRVFYFAFINKNIILLSAFLKKTQKTPIKEIRRAENIYDDVLRRKEIYE